MGEGNVEERLAMFETDDILLAAFLLSKNRPLIAIRQPVSQTRTHFIFVFADPRRTIDAPNGQHQEFLGDGFAPVRTLGRHMARLRACVSQLKSDGNAIEQMKFAELFPPGRIAKKLKLRARQRTQVAELNKPPSTATAGADQFWQCAV